MSNERSRSDRIFVRTLSFAGHGGRGGTGASAPCGTCAAVPQAALFLSGLCPGAARVEYLEEPLTHPSVGAAQELCERLREHGCTTVPVPLALDESLCDLSDGVCAVATLGFTLCLLVRKAASPMSLTQQLKERDGGKSGGVRSGWEGVWRGLANRFGAVTVG